MLIDRYTALLTGRIEEEAENAGLGFQSAIFGSVGRMSDAIQQKDEIRRIAMYPCIGAGEVGNGLLLALVHTFARTADVKRYAVIVQIDEEIISDEPFSPDDWVLDDLNDDVAIWGTLTSTAAGWVWKVFIEDDASEGERITLESVEVDIAGLWQRIPALAGEISAKLGFRSRFELPKSSAVNNADTEAFLTALYVYHRDMLIAALHESSEHSEAQTKTYLQVVRQVNDELVSWVSAVTLADVALLTDRAGIPLEITQEYPQLLTHWDKVCGAFAMVISDDDNAPAPLVTWTLEQLEASVSQRPDSVMNWGVLAQMYNRLQRPDLAVDVCQRAIEAEVNDSMLYFAYADALAGALERGLRLDRLLLSSNMPSDETIPEERLLSLRKGLDSLPKAERLAQYIIEASRHNDMDEVQRGFALLVEIDLEGEQTDGVIQQLSYLEDIHWMIAPLKTATHRGQFMTWLNFARASVFVGETDEAQKAAEKALSLATETHQKAEAQMLLLELDVPALHADLADIVSRLQRKGGEVYEKDLEFMEYLVENAPDYTEGYLALAAAYRRLDEPNTALEVLLDAEKTTKGSPELYLALSELFEDEDELSLAIENTRKGLDLAPMSVPLLAQAALLAYLSADEEGAQAFLRRAHAISPYHARIVAVTRRIQNESDDEDEDLP